MDKKAANERLYLSMVTVGEMERGIVLQRTKHPDFAAVLASWLVRVLALCGDRVLPFDLQVARRWGQLSGA